MAKATSRLFGSTADGRQVTCYTLDNGITEVDIINYGATMVSIRTPDTNAQKADVLLGYDTLEEYQNNEGYFGAVIGRNSNRIKGAAFEINRKEYKLTANQKTINIHGGPDGFDRRLWNVTVVQKENGDCLECTLQSPDMDQGFPGNLQVCVRYSLTDSNALILEYFAKADADTVVNLTNHSYFNLNGHQSGSMLNHRLKIYADFYTPYDEECCPTGEVLSVKDTVYDFTEYHTIGERIDLVPDREYSNGYDHNYMLRTKERQMTLAAEAVGDQSGIRMQVYTNKPAIQFYAGNYISAPYGKSGAPYAPRCGFCLETQYPPNALSLPHFASPILRAGDVYNYTTIFKFGIAE